MTNHTIFRLALQSYYIPANRARVLLKKVGFGYFKVDKWVVESDLLEQIREHRHQSREEYDDRTFHIVLIMVFFFVSAFLDGRVADFRQSGCAALALQIGQYVANGIKLGTCHLVDFVLVSQRVVHIGA